MADSKPLVPPALKAAAAFLALVLPVVALVLPVVPLTLPLLGTLSVPLGGLALAGALLAARAAGVAAPQLTFGASSPKVPLAAVPIFDALGALLAYISAGSPSALLGSATYLASLLCFWLAGKASPTPQEAPAAPKLAPVVPLNAGLATANAAAATTAAAVSASVDANGSPTGE